MSADLTAAIVSASATALVAVVAIVTNNKRLDDTNRRLDDTNSRIGRLESKLDHIETLLVGYVLDVAKIKERLSIS
jgi:hypothetical protein